MFAQPAVAAQIRELSRGALEIFPLADLEKKLASGRPLRVKLGFDPTRPDLHLGHAVALEGLRRFQQAGHQIVVIIGDFTARIGDPTGKETARPPLSPGEIEENARTYLEQLGILIDLARAEIRRNSEWLAGLALEDVIRLLSKATVAQMLARESFARRHERGDAIGLHEFLYPLLQGYDSVAIRADVELGGGDQRFNLLVGRDLQAALGQESQVCITYPLLAGTDGKEKMSKSVENYIGLTMPASEMYGRTMSIPDSLLDSWYRLASGLSEADLARILEALGRGELHPRDAKMRLARAIAARFHGPEAAEQAEEQFVKQFQRRELPDRIESRPVGAREGDICTLLVKAGLCETTSDARRLLRDGAVKVHEAGGPRTLPNDPGQILAVPDAGVILQAGKRRLARLLPGE